MVRRIVAENVVNQVADWGHRGLIDDELLATLKARYASDVTMGGVLLRWLAFIALFMLASSIMGVIGMALGDLAMYLAPFIIGALSFAMWLKGAEVATDPQQRYPMSGSVLVTVGLFGAFGALSTFYELSGYSNERFAMVVMMLLVGAAAFYTAYRYGLRWPLLLGVLLVFHGLGNMHGYWGHGSYFMGISDERVTFAVGMVFILLGLWHERTLEEDLNGREVGFGQVYVVFGLLYANVSAWFLTLPRESLLPVLLFTGFCIAQIIVGARLHDGRFIGFGIVFLSINIYTRLFERFWDEISKGSFFALAGVIAIGVGIAFEMRARKRTKGVAP